MTNSTSLHFADAETGKVLDEHGAWADADRQFHPKFESRKEAEVFMMTLLEQHPHAECWIKSDGTEVATRVVSPKFAAYYREKKEWVRWKMSFWICRVFKPEPVGRYFRPSKGTENSA
jgi:hypothetical protein